MNFPLFTLSYKSLLNRRVSVFLTIISLALSVMLFTGVEKIRQGARQGFENTISGTDLVVGARTGQLNLLLSTVFRIGEGTQGISWHSFDAFAHAPGVAWAVPLSLGDSYRGYRVLGTNEDYFIHYKYGQSRPLEFASGHGFRDHGDVVIGAKVAKELGLKIGQAIHISHGLVATKFAEHKNSNFIISGILKPTGTPVDATVHVTLEGLEMVHEDHHGEEGHADHDHDPDKITAFLMGMNSPPLALRMQYQINNYTPEALTAILPGVTLGQLWSLLGAVEKTLLAISAFVVLTGLLGMMIRIVASLNERRREMAILRSIGARPANIFALLICEASLSAILGSLLGLALLYGGFFLADIVLPETSRIPAFDAIVAQRPGLFDLLVVLGVTIIAAMMAIFPALQASRDSLSDGLTIRV
ncbi:MAG: ABC transporter permease [bacterium]